MSGQSVLPPALETSALLHERVRLFAARSCSESFVQRGVVDTFEALALDIARFQFDHSAGLARLVAQHTGKLEELSDIPPVTTEAFRLGRVAVHPPELDAAVFRTSGTTALPGFHPVRDLSTKEELALLQARRTLFREHRRGLVLALAQRPEGPHESSLGHMMALFMEHFDGRSLSTDPRGGAFDPLARGRWLMEPTGVDLEGLLRGARLSLHRSEPLFLLCTSFALLAALEALDGQKIRTPGRTTIMLTGGFKGHRTRVDEQELRAMARATFGLSEGRIVGEYGMTELSSQLFEGEKPGLYEAPPWLRLQAVDPVSFAPLPQGQEGLAHFLDLANVDSSLSVLTRDVVRVTDEGVQLLGRAQGASPRGCSLPYEGLLERGRSPGANVQGGVRQ